MTDMRQASDEQDYITAARNAIDFFPVEARRLDLVAQSENVTFRVRVSNSDTSYVLRLHRPGYSTIEELESERVWVKALGDTGVAVQESIRTLQGDHYVLVDVPGTAERRYAGMTTWREGTRLREFLDNSPDSGERRQVFRRFGEIAATFHDQATNWKSPPGFCRRRLDLDALLGEAPFWGRFWEHPDLSAEERRTLLGAREAMRAAIESYGVTGGNFSLIHADFTPDNVIYDGHDLAVIDFDDSAFGWHLYDIASGLIEIRGDRDFELLQAAFLDGYQDRRKLSQLDIKLLPDFLLVRGMAVIGWFLQRPEFAGAAEFERVRRWVIDECRRRGH